MRTIWLYQAEGTDPRLIQRDPDDPTKEQKKVIKMYFGYEPEMSDVVLKLQEVLGYVPSVADTFPFSVSPFNPLYHPANDEPMTFVLDKDMHVAMPMGGETVPAGTIIKIEAGTSLLFSSP